MASNIFSTLPQPDARLFTQPSTSVTVLIVGCGPSGLFLAYLLAKQGIRSAILDKHALRLGQPKAHAVNPRSLEIFRQAGLDTVKLRSKGTPADEAFWVRWIMGLTGAELGKLPYERQDDAIRDVTPEPLFNIPQPALEGFLEEATLATGLVTIHRRWLWERYEIDTSGHPISHVRNRNDDGNQSLLRIKSAYLIGADGANSTVRDKIPGVDFGAPGGVPMSKNHYRSIHCHADLRSALEAHGLDRASELYFCCNPSHPAGIISYGLSSSFVHVTPATNASSSAPLTADECRKLVEPCMPGVSFEPESVTTWYTWPRIASVYGSDSGRVLLVSDAAHSFPPQGGLGVNTGIADAHNLAWKLKLALDIDELGGDAQAHAAMFLRTYTAERKPVAVANALQSARNEQVGIEVDQGLREIMRQSDDLGMSLGDYLANPAVKARVTQLLSRNKPHFDSLVLQLGYIYGSGDGTRLLDDVSRYEPSAVPGARLPHAWLADGRSTLDCIPYDADSFVLLYRQSDLYAASSPETSTIEVGPARVVAVDVDSFRAPEDWCELLGLSPGKSQMCLLVRPDQHILARVCGLEDAAAEVRRYLCVEPEGGVGVCP